MTLIIAIFGLVVALAAALFTFWQATLSRRSLGAETLLRLDDVWRSAEMRKVRAAAAATLLDKRKTGKTAQKLYESDQTDVDEVLNYFETIAFFCTRKVLDRKLVWNMFYWSIEHYWLACAYYVEHVRLNEGHRVWENVSLQLPHLRKLNRDDPQPNDATVGPFLRAEAAMQDSAAGPVPP